MIRTLVEIVTVKEDVVMQGGTAQKTIPIPPRRVWIMMHLLLVPCAQLLHPQGNAAQTAAKGPLANSAYLGIGASSATLAQASSTAATMESPILYVRGMGPAHKV